MKRFSIIISLFMALSSFDKINILDNFKFGLEYNSVRFQFGAPLISKKMILQDGYGSWAVYNLDKEPMDRAYHYSKAVCAYDNDKVYNEKDVYRKNLDDTTIMQLDMNILYDWDNKKLIAQGSFGKLDKRSFSIKSEDYSKSTPLKFPRYEFQVFDLSQIDTLLKSWQLSRHDSD